MNQETRKSESQEPESEPEAGESLVDYYGVLGVDRSATKKEIKKQANESYNAKYEEISAQRDAGDIDEEAAAETIQMLSDARETLVDNKKREEYNAFLTKKSLEETPVESELPIGEDIEEKLRDLLPARAGGAQVGKKYTEEIGLEVLKRLHPKLEDEAREEARKKEDPKVVLGSEIKGLLSKEGYHKLEGLSAERIRKNLFDILERYERKDRKAFQKKKKDGEIPKKEPYENHKGDSLIGEEAENFTAVREILNTIAAVGTEERPVEEIDKDLTVILGIGKTARSKNKKDQRQLGQPSESAPGETEKNPLKEEGAAVEDAPTQVASETEEERQRQLEEQYRILSGGLVPPESRDNVSSTEEGKTEKGKESLVPEKKSLLELLDTLEENDPDKLEDLKKKMAGERVYRFVKENGVRKKQYLTLENIHKDDKGNWRSDVMVYNEDGTVNDVESKKKANYDIGKIQYRHWEKIKDDNDLPQGKVVFRGDDGRFSTLDAESDKADEMVKLEINGDVRLLSKDKIRRYEYNDGENNKVSYAFKSLTRSEAAKKFKEAEGFRKSTEGKEPEITGQWPEEIKQRGKEQLEDTLKKIKEIAEKGSKEHEQWKKKYSKNSKKEARGVEELKEIKEEKELTPEEIDFNTFRVQREKAMAEAEAYRSKGIWGQIKMDLGIKEGETVGGWLKGIGRDITQVFTFWKNGQKTENKNDKGVKPMTSTEQAAKPLGATLEQSKKERSAIITIEEYNEIMKKGGMPFLITQRIKRTLNQLGVKNEEINNLNVSEKWNLLGRKLKEKNDIHSLELEQKDK